MDDHDDDENDSEPVDDSDDDDDGDEDEGEDHDEMFQHFFGRSRDAFIRFHERMRQLSREVAMPLICCYWIFIIACLLFPKLVHDYIFKIDDAVLIGFVHIPIVIATIAARLLLGSLKEADLEPLCDSFWVWVFKMTILLALLESTTVHSLGVIASFLFQVGAMNLVCTLAKLKYGNFLRQLSKQPHDSVRKILVLLIPLAVYAIYFLATMAYLLALEYGNSKAYEISSGKPMRGVDLIAFPYLLLMPFYFMLLIRLLYVISDCGAYCYGVLEDRPPLGCFYYFKLSSSIIVSLGNAFVCGIAIAYSREWTRYVVLMGVVYIAQAIYNSMKRFAIHQRSVKLAKTMEAAVDLPSIDELREYDDVCPICTEKLIALNCVKVKTCGHVYHKNCLLIVVFAGNNLCPMCRQPIIVANV